MWAERAPAPLRRLRRAVGAARRWWHPSPEVAAWQTACRAAERAPRYMPGEIALDRYRIAYADLLTLCPQWYDLFVRRVLAFRAPHDSPRIIDGGANIGLASLFFKRLYPKAVVSAYEADPALAELCRRNVMVNGAGDVDVRHAALWTREGSLAFRCEGSDAGAVDALGTGVAGTQRDVPCVRLRDVLADEKAVDLLKIDIEGAEFDVLGDCGSALARVQALLLDVHEFSPHERHVPALLQMLTNSGFVYTLDHLMPLPWRGEAGDTTPFPRAATSWAALVRAWRA